MAETNFIEERKEWLKTQEELFKKFVQLNVNDYTETKNDLTYLSWAWAWQKTLEICPTATYEVKMFMNGTLGKTTPYIESDLGYMVFTSVTIEGLTREMWLPVMDGANKAMKKEPYTYQGKYGEKTVEAATMFDVNKTIMRCLTKNLAVFGLGLYIYAGEDTPADIGEPVTEEQLKQIRELKIIEVNVCKKFKINTINELTRKQAEFVINAKKKAIETENGRG